jgi:hypothetical protein
MMSVSLLVVIAPECMSGALAGAIAAAGFVERGPVLRRARTARPV